MLSFIDQHHVQTWPAVVLTGCTGYTGYTGQSGYFWMERTHSLTHLLSMEGIQVWLSVNDPINLQTYCWLSDNMKCEVFNL